MKQGVGESRVNVLLTTRRELSEQRNPIALLDLAAYLRAFGHEVDCYYLDQLHAQRAPHKAYDIVGLSVLQAVNEKTPLRDALNLKRKFKTETVVGGKWTQTATEEEKQYLKDHGITLWVGAGELYFAHQEFHVDTYPSWDRIDFETLREVRTDVMSTRGCPYRCHFCHNTEKKLSFFSAQRTADHMELLLRLGMKRISFVDDIFTLKPAHMEALYHEWKARNLPIEGRNEFFTHINCINEGTLKWMKRYKPFQVSVGIESGDDGMLKRMGKGFDAETAYQKLKMLHEAIRVPIGTLFLIGFPGETEESLQHTLTFIKRIRPFSGSWVSYYQPVRGTPGYEIALARTPNVKAGRRNMVISYVDPGLTKKLLFKYNYKMMDYSEDGILRKKLAYFLMDLLPVWFLSRIRSIRQKSRLRNYMDHLATG
jgi:radical SAM superfamily enzyme YgiQ (UPF0313 family)